jgi:hypothetical protein
MVGAKIEDVLGGKRTRRVERDMVVRTQLTEPVVDDAVPGIEAGQPRLEGKAAAELLACFGNSHRSRAAPK